MQSDQNEIESFKIETTITVGADMKGLQIPHPASESHLAIQLQEKQNTKKMTPYETTIKMAFLMFLNKYSVVPAFFCQLCFTCHYRHR
ncbi:hypothetical protein [Janthinobacterium sp. BJB426]|uniref:hypothetical protein n=1 Tax=Janthinobacterium sp. BJB426 TaxID=2048010 RepID=UPI0013053A88|nr:hypothetical protein [Janthinobacterium sp. BJB426]